MRTPLLNHPIDVATTGDICPKRLERALSLSVTPLDPAPGHYRVSGGSEPHYVNLSDPTAPRCDCGDHIWRDAICAHLLAALYHRADTHVLDATRGLAESLRQTIARAENTLRGYRIRLTPALKKHVATTLGISPTEVAYHKHSLTDGVGATVLHAPTGEVLGEVVATRPTPRFEKHHTR